MDLTRRLVTVAGQEVPLTPTEYALLKVLVAHAGKVLTHPQLLSQEWGTPYQRERHLLQVNISNLRRKLEPDLARPPDTSCSSRASGTGYESATEDVNGPVPSDL